MTVDPADLWDQEPYKSPFTEATVVDGKCSNCGATAEAGRIHFHKQPPPESDAEEGSDGE